jgi:hypothetical protein
VRVRALHSRWMLAFSLLPGCSCSSPSSPDASNDAYYACPAPDTSPYGLELASPISTGVLIDCVAPYCDNRDLWNTELDQRGPLLFVSGSGSGPESPQNAAHVFGLDATGLIAREVSMRSSVGDSQRVGRETVARMRRDGDPLMLPDAPSLLDWVTLDGTTIFPPTDMHARFAASGSCRNVSPTGGLVVAPDDSRLWFVSTGCAGDHALHVMRPDLTEPLGELGLPIESPLGFLNGFGAEMPLRDAFVGTGDGGVWVVTERSGLGMDVALGLRASRYDADGGLVAVSGVLLSSSLLIPDAIGVWAESDPVDDALFLHVAALHDAATMEPASHILRIEPDGSTSWHWISPTSAIAFGVGGHVAVAQDGGGGVWAVLLSSDEASVSLMRIDRRGGVTGGATPDLTVPRPNDPYFGPVTWVSVARDDAGGAFVLARALDPLLLHFDASRTRTWPADPFDLSTDPALGFAEEMIVDQDWFQMVADTRGGVWVAQNVSSPYAHAALQHVDATGRALFLSRGYRCVPARDIIIGGDGGIAVSSEAPWPRAQRVSADAGLDADDAQSFDGSAVRSMDAAASGD